MRMTAITLPLLLPSLPGISPLEKSLLMRRHHPAKVSITMTIMMMTTMMTKRLIQTLMRCKSGF